MREPMDAKEVVCKFCDDAVFLIQDADGDWIHGVDFTWGTKILCTRQSRIGIKRWTCTTCQPDGEYQANMHEKSTGDPAFLVHDLTSGTYTIQVCVCPCHRDKLGEIVRNIWINWARNHPQPKPSWLVPYEQLSESDKEADRCIGATLLSIFIRWMRAER